MFTYHVYDQIEDQGWVQVFCVGVVLYEGVIRFDREADLLHWFLKLNIKKSTFQNGKAGLSNPICICDLRLARFSHL